MDGDSFEDREIEKYFLRSKMSVQLARAVLLCFESLGCESLRNRGVSAEALESLIELLANSSVKFPINAYKSAI